MPYLLMGENGEETGKDEGEREYGIESDGTGRNVRRGEGTENEKLGKLREHRRRMGKVGVKRREKKGDGKRKGREEGWKSRKV